MEKGAWLSDSHLVIVKLRDKLGEPANAGCGDSISIIANGGKLNEYWQKTTKGYTFVFA